MRYLLLLLIPIAVTAGESPQQELEKACKAEGGCVTITRLALEQALVHAYVQGKASVSCKGWL